MKTQIKRVADALVSAVRGSPRPLIYCAVSEFIPEANAIERELRDLCGRYGCEFSPWPNWADLGPTRPAAELLEIVYRTNLRLIRGASAIVADVSPFRGPRTDADVAFQIGHAIASSKPVFAYTSEPRRERRDERNELVEDFGFLENLMVAHSIRSLSHSPEDAIRRCAEHFGCDNRRATAEMPR